MADSQKRPPAALGRRGKALWRVLHSELEFDAHEEAIVLEACRTADVIDDLAAVVEKAGVMSTGSTGQVVVHPAVPELRQQQAALSRLLTSLNLSDALDGGSGQVAISRAISSSAQAAANARWNRSKGARGA